MKEIKDYLPYYFHCTILVEYNGEEILCRIVNLSGEGNGFISGYTKDLKLFNSYGRIKGKLLLCPLSSMTEEECLQVVNLWGGANHLMDDSKIHQVRQLFDKNGYHNKVTNISGSSWNKVINYCRQQGVDMDGLIEAGLAIDKTTLK